MQTGPSAGLESGTSSGPAAASGPGLESGTCSGPPAASRPILESGTSSVPPAASPPGLESGTSSGPAASSRPGLEGGTCSSPPAASRSSLPSHPLPKHPARSGAASLETTKGIATLRLEPSSTSSLPEPGSGSLASVVRRAGGDLAKLGSKVHTVFVWATGSASAGTLLGYANKQEEDGPGEAVEELQKLPQLSVGLVDRPTSCSETCLLAACSLVLATTEACFLLAEDSQRRGNSRAACTPAVPLSLLRHLGPGLAEHLAGNGGATAITVDASQAQQLGLVSEIVQGSEALQYRKEELADLLICYPTAATALRYWPRHRGTPAVGALPVAPAPSSSAPSRLAGGAKRSPAWADLQVPLAKRCMLLGPGSASDLRAGAGAGGSVSQDPVSAKCAAVGAALLGSSWQKLDGEQQEELPFQARALLNMVITGSLGVPRNKREDLQDKVVDFLQQMLTALEERLQRSVEDSQSIVEGADAVRVAREGLLAGAEARIVSLREVVAKKKHQLAEDTMALREAAKALELVNNAQEAGNASLDSATAQKEQLESARRDMYQPLKDGTVARAKAKRTATSLVAFGKKFDFDETLLLGLPEVLTMRPSVRGAFDVMVLNAFETQVDTRIAELETTLAEGAPDKERREAAVSYARATHEAAGRMQQRSVAALEAARTTHTEAEASLAAAQAAVRDFLPELRQLEAAREYALGQLLAFRQGPLAAFDELRTLEAADEPNKQNMDAKTGLANYCSTVRGALTEEKLRDRFESGDREKIEKALRDTLDWLEKNLTAEKGSFNARQKELEGFVNPIMTKVHQAAGGSSGMPEGGMPGGGSNGGRAAPGDAGQPTTEEVD